MREGVVSAFNTITSSLCAHPEWLTEGKTRLIPKQGMSYKWFTSCVLGPMDQHLKVYDVIEEQQRREGRMQWKERQPTD